MTRVDDKTATRNGAEAAAERTRAGCAQPGYVELAGSWSFDATPNPSVVCDNGTVPLTITPRLLHAVTVTSDNQVQEADLTDPAGIHHHYTYQFDTRGALASKTDTSTNTSTTYSYDVFGNLRSVALPGGHTITYAIDAAQRRVGKAIDGTTVQAFLYQSALQPVAELDGDGQVRRLFVYADKPNVPEYMIRPADAEHLSAHSYRIITDHLGSVRLVVDAGDGTIMQRMDYDEHGNVLFDYVAPDFERVPFGYAGGLYDPDTGVVRFGARDYDPEIARWTARDPTGFNGGDGNLYGYVAGDAVNSTDATGLAWGGGDPVCEESGDCQGRTIGIEGPFQLRFTGNQVGKKATGALTVEDALGVTLKSYPAVSGPFKKGSLPDGPYTASNLVRTHQKGMVCNGFGYKLYLTPHFKTTRNKLRIHGDQPPIGTEGCIGIQCNASRNFYDDVEDYFAETGSQSIELDVDVPRYRLRR